MSNRKAPRRLLSSSPPEIGLIWKEVVPNGSPFAPPLRRRETARLLVRSTGGQDDRNDDPIMFHAAQQARIRRSETAG